MDSSTQQVANTALDIIQFLSSPWAAAISFIVGIIGLLLALISLRYLKRKVPTYLIRSFTIISSPLEKPEGLEIRYANEIVEQLTISRLLFFNDGREVINRDDVPSSGISIVLTPGTKVFGLPTILCTYNGSDTGFGVAEREYGFELDFEYLAKDEGGVVQLIHSGTDRDVRLEGRLKERKSFRRITTLLNYKPFLAGGIIYFGLPISAVVASSLAKLAQIFNLPIANEVFFLLFLAPFTVFIYFGETLAELMTQKLSPGKSLYLKYINQNWEI